MPHPSQFIVQAEMAGILETGRISSIMSNGSMKIMCQGKKEQESIRPKTIVRIVERAESIMFMS